MFGTSVNSPFKDLGSSLIEALDELQNAFIFLLLRTLAAFVAAVRTVLDDNSGARLRFPLICRRACAVPRRVAATCETVLREMPLRVVRVARERAFFFNMFAFGGNKSLGRVDNARFRMARLEASSIRSYSSLLGFI